MKTAGCTVNVCLSSLARLSKDAQAVVECSRAGKGGGLNPTVIWWTHYLADREPSYPFLT